MSKQLYRNFIKLLRDWPLDEWTKRSDLGETLRIHVSKKFAHGETSSLTLSEISKCEEIYESLKRLVGNNHAKKYPRLFDSSSTGLSVEHCGRIRRLIDEEESSEKLTQKYFLNGQHTKYSVLLCILKKDLNQCLFPKSHSTLVSSYNEHTDPPKKCPHIPVLCQEVVEGLEVKENGVYLDMTFGSGGHTQMILKKHPSVKVYGLDRDPHVKKFADDLKDRFPDQFQLLTGKFSNLPQLLHEKGIGCGYFNGVCMDLGPSSMQFDNPERGFMFSKNGPLDMRMDGKSDPDTPTASEILAHIDEISLYKVLKYYGEEKQARMLARALIESRLMFKSLNTTQELAQFITYIKGGPVMTDKLNRFSHPATKTFQALRILVNDELNELDCGIRLAHYFLQTGGILAAISFHSLEDTILKRHITGTDIDKTPATIGGGIRKHTKSHLVTFEKIELSEQFVKPWHFLTKHVIVPSEEEVQINPRSRSAKLRLASKLMAPHYSTKSGSS